MKQGILYGVGVGPGDPELMTVKAWRLISTTPVIAYLTANGKDTTARNIASPFIPEDVIEVGIEMPMRVEREPAQRAYDQGATEIATLLKSGKDVVFLCEGDPFFYGSFMYLFDRLANQFETVVVPGVTSMAAASAQIRVPLSRRDDVVKILPATMTREKLISELRTADTAVVIKVGRHFGKVKTALTEIGLHHHAIAIENATHKSELIRSLTEIEGDTLPYFTTILVRKGATS